MIYPGELRSMNRGNFGMNTQRMYCILAVCALGLSCGYALAAEPASLLTEASSVAWSIRGDDEEMTIRVSPARQTLAIGGTIGNVLGKSIDVVANDRHEKRVEELLAGYDPGAVYVERIREVLSEQLNASLTEVEPMGSAAKYSSPEEAEDARFDRLAKEGHDALLDLKIAYGLFGVEGTLVAKIDGKLYALDSGRRVWSETIVVIEQPILGTQKLKDPTKQFLPNVSSPRLTAKKDAIGQWSGDDGLELRSRYETAVNGAVRGVVSSLGLDADPVGEYSLGKMALYKKKFERAEERFLRAIELAPGSPDARNGLVVTLGHEKRVDEALSVAHGLASDHPEYGPAWFNLAWLYAVGMKDGASAVEPYERALELGMPSSKRIEKRLEKTDEVTVALHERK